MPPSKPKPEEPEVDAETSAPPTATVTRELRVGVKRYKQGDPIHGRDLAQLKELRPDCVKEGAV